MKTNELVYGHGMNDLDGPVSKNGKLLKFYTTWHSMLCRCYSEKRLAKHRTYRGCTVCDEWLLLSNFKKWYDINYREGTALDKDILIPGNKIYCPEACRFVPQYINNLLTNAGAIRGDLPCGVVARKSKLKNGRISITYMARCWDGRGRMRHSTFKTIPEAVAWYSATKTRVAGQQAVRAYTSGEITGDVYQALITRQW